jgi:hypothetical protein
MDTTPLQSLPEDSSYYNHSGKNQNDTEIELYHKKTAQQTITTTTDSNNIHGGNNNHNFEYLNPYDTINNPLQSCDVYESAENCRNFENQNENSIIIPIENPFNSEQNGQLNDGEDFTGDSNNTNTNRTNRGNIDILSTLANTPDNFNYLDALQVPVELEPTQTISLFGRKIAAYLLLLAFFCVLFAVGNVAVIFTLVLYPIDTWFDNNPRPPIGINASTTEIIAAAQWDYKQNMIDVFYFYLMGSYSVAALIGMFSFTDGFGGSF